jgi:hypothetical protein
VALDESHCDFLGVRECEMLVNFGTKAITVKILASLSFGNQNLGINQAGSMINKLGKIPRLRCDTIRKIITTLPH